MQATLPQANEESATSAAPEHVPEATPPTPRLHRSERDRIIAGVCGGLAEYLAIDPSLVRIAFVVATLWGVGLLLYIVLAIILPTEDSAFAPTAFSMERSHALAGTVLVVLGLALLAANMGWAPWLNWNMLWPTVLIVVGIGVLVRGPRGRTSD